MIVTASSLRLPFADATFHSALGSPPYWGGLRTYAGPQARDWPAISYAPMPGLPPVEIPAQTVALGHEPDPFAFVGHLLAVYREVRRVLRPDGCLAVNLGDCYATGAGGAKSPGGGRQGERWTGASSQINRQPLNGMRSKNLLLMPWRLALAMQADGWILRSRMPGGIEMEPNVVWWKKSTMPESVRDRPTVDFEDVLIFAQRGTYFWDQEAGREAHTMKPQGRSPSAAAVAGNKYSAVGNAHTGSKGVREHGVDGIPAGRNMRTVWTINPEPTDEEHFAAWPRELAARLIRVMTSERGCCPECGAPWERVVERRGGPPPGDHRKRDNYRETAASAVHPTGVVTGGALSAAYAKYGYPRRVTTGWRSTCAHDREPIPCRALDPFAGLGRTWEAARETGRRFAGADLAPEYCRLARSRNDLAAAERRRTAEARVEKTISGPLFEL